MSQLIALLASISTHGAALESKLSPLPPPLRFFSPSSSSRPLIHLVEATYLAGALSVIVLLLTFVVAFPSRREREERRRAGVEVTWVGVVLRVGSILGVAWGWSAWSRWMGVSSMMQVIEDDGLLEKLGWEGW